MLSNEEFIKKSKEKTKYTGKRNNVILTCKRHGDFLVNAGNHMYKKAGCAKCSNNFSPSTQEWVEKAKQKFPNYDYSKVKYINNKKNVIIICKKHGEFKQTPSNFLKNNGCKECYKEYKISLYKEYFLEMAKKLFKDKFDYSKSNIINSKKKIEIICPEHKSFFQEPYVHLNSKYGCPKCQPSPTKGKLKYSTKEYIDEIKAIQGNKYDYSITVYNGMNEFIKYICPNHGVIKQNALKHIKGYGCRLCNESHGEKRIRVYLEKQNITFNRWVYIDELNKLKNTDFPNKFLSYDFYVPDFNLLIEYNGEQHYYKKCFKKTYKEFLLQKHHDWLKRKYAKHNNINLLIIPYWDFDNIEKTLEIILTKKH